MKYLKKFESKSAAIGKKIPSPCVAKYEAEQEVDYFHPMKNAVVTSEMFVITMGASGPQASEYCDIHDNEVLRIVSQCYGTNGQNPKVADVYDDDFTAHFPGVLSGNTAIKNISGLGPILSNGSNYFNLFRANKSATTIDVSDIDTSSCTGSCSNSFAELPYITEITGFEKWNTAEMTEMGAVFAYLGQSAKTSNISFDLSSWDISKVRTIGSMFYGCTTLRSVGDIGGWDVSNKTAFQSLFYNCNNLEYVGGIDRWDVSNGTSFRATFYECGKLPNIEDIVSKWNLSSATNTDYMLYYTGIKHIVFPKNIKVVGYCMYARNGNIPFAETEDITIPDSVEILDAEWAINQRNIKRIYIGKNVYRLGRSADTSTFNDVFGLEEEIVISPENQYFKTENHMVFTKNGKKTYGGSMGYFVTGATDIVVPEGVEIIIGGAFRAGVHSETQEFWDNAYTYSGLTRHFVLSAVTLTGITFPSTTTYIGDRVLQYAKNYDEVRILATTPPTLQATTFFNQRKSTARIRVPAASVNAYKAATTWSSYASIIEAIPS